MSALRAIHRGYLNLSLYPRLALGFALVLTFTGIMASVLLMEVANISTTFDQVELARQKATLVNTANNGSIGEIEATLDQLWSGRTATNMQGSRTSVHNDYVRLHNLETDPAWLAKIDDLNHQIDAIYTLLDNTLQLDNAGKSIEARIQWVKISVAFAAYDQGVEALATRLDTSVQNTIRDAQQTRQNAVILIVLCAILALIAGVSVAYGTARSITRRARVISRAMQRVAETNLLIGIRGSLEGRDELTLMAHSFNRMLEKLSIAITVLHDTGQTVESSSQYFSNTAQRQLGAAEQEVQAIGIIVSATNQLNSTAFIIDERAALMTAQANDNLQYIAQITQAVIDSSKQVAQTHVATQNVSAGIQHIFSQTAQAITEVQELVAQLASIQHIADGLAAIARETHLLALNAAIESAGAGEMGVRFGVIASAVKELADQSHNLVNRVGGIMAQIETKVNNVTAVMRQTNHTLDQSQHLVQTIEQTGHASLRLANSITATIQQINHLVDQTYTQAQDIAQAAQEQRAATNAIITTVRTVERAVQDNMQDHRTSFRAVTSLQNEVARLTTLVGSLNAIER